ncbi:circumsporozoite protein [Trichonephila clavipes]|nr:circumsporozoite protein [Trichonephila clavipes]
MARGLPPTSREDLRLDGYLEYPHAVKALSTYRHQSLPRDSNPVPTAPQSASLTTIPVGRQNMAESANAPLNELENEREEYNYIMLPRITNERWREGIYSVEGVNVQKTDEKYIYERDLLSDDEELELFASKHLFNLQMEYVKEENKRFQEKFKELQKVMGERREAKKEKKSKIVGAGVGDPPAIDSVGADPPPQETDIPAGPPQKPTDVAAGPPSQKPTGVAAGPPSQKPTGVAAGPPSQKPTGVAAGPPSQKPTGVAAGPPSQKPTGPTGVAAGPPSQKPTGVAAGPPSQKPTGVAAGPPSQKPTGVAAGPPSQKPTGVAAGPPSQKPTGVAAGPPSQKPTGVAAGPPSSKANRCCCWPPPQKPTGVAAGPPPQKPTGVAASPPPPQKPTGVAASPPPQKPTGPTGVAASPPPQKPTGVAASPPPQKETGVAADPPSQQETDVADPPPTPSKNPYDTRAKTKTLHESFGDGSRNFEPRSSDEDDTRAGTSCPNYHTNGWTFELSTDLTYIASLQWYWARTRDTPALNNLFLNLILLMQE